MGLDSEAVDPEFEIQRERRERSGDRQMCIMYLYLRGFGREIYADAPYSKRDRGAEVYRF